MVNITVQIMGGTLLSLEVAEDIMVRFPPLLRACSTYMWGKLGPSCCLVLERAEI